VHLGIMVSYVYPVLKRAVVAVPAKMDGFMYYLFISMGGVGCP
jgi:hypothetical protein